MISRPSQQQNQIPNTSPNDTLSKENSQESDIKTCSLMKKINPIKEYSIYLLYLIQIAISSTWTDGLLIHSESRKGEPDYGNIMTLSKFLQRLKSHINSVQWEEAFRALASDLKSQRKAQKLSTKW